MTCATSTPSSFRLYAVSLDPLQGSNTDSAQDREQDVAISAQLDNNSFVPVEHGGGHYRLILALVDRHLRLSVRTERGAHVLNHHLSLTSFRRLFKAGRLHYASRIADLTTQWTAIWRPL